MALSGLLAGHEVISLIHFLKASLLDHNHKPIHAISQGGLMSGTVPGVPVATGPYLEAP